MKANVLLLLILPCYFFASAQKSPLKFGEVSMDELTMTTYPQDSSASAVILSDYGEAYLAVTTVTANLNFERHVRIKILKKEGLSWADVSIPLYDAGSSEEIVRSLKAMSYNLEGGKIIETKLSSEGIFKEKFNRNFKVQKFTIPNVKEGSVIEFSYKIVSDFLFNFPNWQFQYSIPVKHSEYWAVIPEFCIFEKYMQGYLQISNYEVKDKPMADYQSKAHHYVLDNVPAFKEEPYITCEDDYVSKINFALSHLNFRGSPTQEIMGSWGKLNNDLLESDGFGKMISGNGWLKKKTEEILAGVTDPSEKINVVYNYIRNEIAWDGTKDFLADPLKKVFEVKKGTAGDINLALASMLDKAGVDVEMIILSTRDHGVIRQAYPMRKQFNYVVCAAYVNGKTILLDATEKFLPVNVLPERCLNGEGLLISKKQPQWIPLKPNAKSRTVVSAELALNSSGDIAGKLNFSRDGYDANRMRKEYISKGEENYVKDFLKSRTWQVEKTNFENITELSKLAKEIHEVTIQEHATKAGDVIYLNPFVTSQLESNPFKLEERLYPVDFGSPIENVYMCRLTIPEGYSVDELPQSKVYMLPGNAAKYMYNVSLTGNTINITSNLQVNKNLFIQTEYLDLREFYNQVVAKQGEQIVLKKK